MKQKDNNLKELKNARNYHSGGFVPNMFENLISEIRIYRAITIFTNS